MRALSSVDEAALCRSEAGEKEKLRERAAVWEGEGYRLLPLPTVARAPPIFPLLLFLLGYPAGASGEERAVREKGNKQHGRGPELVPLTLVYLEKRPTSFPFLAKYWYI